MNTKYIIVNIKIIKYTTMYQTKYSVKIPQPDGTYEEIIFNTSEETSKFLKISKFTLRSIINGTCSFHNKNTKAIQNYIISELIPMSSPRLDELYEQIRQEKARLKALHNFH